MRAENLQTIEQLNQFMKQSGKQILFKHSTICPVSEAAYGEFQAYLDEEDTSSAIIHVIEQRSISNKVEELLKITHESPQIFLLEDGEVKWHTSHWKITRESIKEAVK